MDTIPKKMFELDLFIDDFYLFNSTSASSDFENDDDWQINFSDKHTGITQEFSTADFRSGEQSCRFIIRKDALKGSYAEVSQNVTLE